MKTNELMIGDWIYVPHNGSATHYARVLGIYERDVVSNELDKISGLTKADVLEPIPITPEILEKNGFKFDGSGQCSMMFLSEPRFSEGQRFNIYIGLKHKTIEVFVAHPIEKSPNWRKTNKVYLEVCGPYVHELQQALRLCGIDKEIVL